MRVATSDWHLLGARDAEPCDRSLVERLVAKVKEFYVEEFLLVGDIFDRTRGINDDAFDYFVEKVLNPLRGQTYTTMIRGNHEEDYDTISEVARKLFDKGADPKWFCFSSGPESRGRFRIEHGSRLDPWCDKHGSFRTTVGEIFTRLDHYGDKIGVDLEKVNPLDLFTKLECVALDLPLHRSFNLYAATTKTHLICGHSHMMYELSSSDWSVHNTGALTKGHKLEYILFDEDSIQLVTE